MSDEVRVWSIRLDLSAERVAALAALLSPDERERMGRFAFPQLRRRYAAAHGALRQILGQQLGRPLERLRFRVGLYGKPVLHGPEAEALEFNLSHSEERALVATVWRRRVGVDLERRRPVPDADAIAQRFFSLSERAALRAVPPEARADAFLRCWTRKEAYLKARGDGLSLPLHGFDVALDGPARLIACRLDPAEPARWELRTIDLGAEYEAALAVEGCGWCVREMAWPT